MKNKKICIKKYSLFILASMFLLGVLWPAVNVQAQNVNRKILPSGPLNGYQSDYAKTLKVLVKYRTLSAHADKTENQPFALVKTANAADVATSCYFSQITENGFVYNNFSATGLPAFFNKNGPSIGGVYYDPWSENESWSDTELAQFKKTIGNCPDLFAKLFGSDGKINANFRKTGIYFCTINSCAHEFVHENFQSNEYLRSFAQGVFNSLPKNLRKELFDSLPSSLYKNINDSQRINELTAYTFELLFTNPKTGFASTGSALTFFQGNYAAYTYGNNFIFRTSSGYVAYDSSSHEFISLLNKFDRTFQVSVVGTDDVYRSVTGRSTLFDRGILVFGANPIPGKPFDPYAVLANGSGGVKDLNAKVLAVSVGTSGNTIYVLKFDVQAGSTNLLPDGGTIRMDIKSKTIVFQNPDGTIAAVVTIDGIVITDPAKIKILKDDLVQSILKNSDGVDLPEGQCPAGQVGAPPNCLTPLSGASLEPGLQQNFAVDTRNSSLAKKPAGYYLLEPIPCKGDAGNTDCVNGKLTSFDPAGEGKLSKYLNIIIKIFIGLCAVAAMVMIVVGGVEYMMSELISGKQAAKDRIVSALLGLVLALGAYTILFTINPDLLITDLKVNDSTSTPTTVPVSQDGKYNLLQPLSGCDNTQPGCVNGKLTSFDPTASDQNGGNIALGKYLNIIIKLIIGLCALLAAGIIVLGGVEYSVSGAASGKQAAKDRIIGALLGLTLLLGSYTLLYTINPDLLQTDLKIDNSVSTATISPPKDSKGYNLLQPIPCDATTVGDGCNKSTNMLESFDPSGGLKLGKYLNIIIKLIIGLCALLAAGIIVLGGVEYSVSGLVSGKQAAKDKILSALFGLILLLGSYALLYTINPDLLKTEVDVAGVTLDVNLTEFENTIPTVGPGTIVDRKIVRIKRGGALACSGGLVTIGNTVPVVAKYKNVGICPDVLSKLKEVHDIFPNFTITSTIRNWGSDCHFANKANHGNCADVVPTNGDWGGLCLAIARVGGLNFANEAISTGPCNDLQPYKKETTTQGKNLHVNFRGPY